jgi:hypothetical protein
LEFRNFSWLDKEPTDGFKLRLIKHLCIQTETFTFQSLTGIALTSAYNMQDGEYENLHRALVTLRSGVFAGIRRPVVIENLANHGPVVNQELSMVTIEFIYEDGSW